MGTITAKLTFPERQTATGKAKADSGFVPMRFTWYGPAAGIIPVELSEVAPAHLEVFLQAALPGAKIEIAVDGIWQADDDLSLSDSELEDDDV